MRVSAKAFSAAVVVAAAVSLIAGSAEAALSRNLQKCQATIAKESQKYLKTILKLESKCNNAELKSPGSCAGPDAAKIAKAESKLRLKIEGKCGWLMTVICSRTGELCVDDSDCTECSITGDECATTPECPANTCDNRKCSVAGTSCVVNSDCPGGEICVGSCAITATACQSDSGCQTNSCDVPTDNQCFDNKQKITDPNPDGLEFPGSCIDPDGPPFSVDNIKDCMIDRHNEKASEMLTEQYGSTTGPLTGTPLKCQFAVAKSGAKFLTSKLKALEKKCRSAIDKGKLSLSPSDCEAESKTSAAIQKATDKLNKTVSGKCSDTDIAALDVCSPPATTVTGAETCLLESHGIAATVLINIEHPAPPACGDNDVNQVTEECDGTDDLACPNSCGGPTSFFPCLCTDVPRIFVRYFSSADLETGWTGKSHDGKVVDGGGYLAAVSHCGELDPPLNDPDICLTGPACVTEPQLCSTDADCPGADTCKRTPQDTGPHCANNLQQACIICSGGSKAGQRCVSGLDCPGGTCLSCDPGVECILSRNGFPLPIAGGGTSVCVDDILVDNVSGTLNLATGESQEFLHEASVTYLNPSKVSMPCPVCGGFCASAGGLGGLCAADSDCAPGDSCVLGSICNTGPNQGKPCRPNPPGGGQTVGFGNTSLDCPPSPGQNISSAGLDIAYDPFVTGVLTVAATTTCTNFKVCTGDQSACTLDSDCTAGQVCKSICSGTLEPCTGASDCPGTQTCDAKCAGNGEECITASNCPSGQVCVAPIACYISTQKVPNDCSAACIGGIDAWSPCITGSDCASGECRPRVCVLDPSDPDNPAPKQCSTSATSCADDSDCPSGETCDSLNPTEGFCIAGPAFGECSIEKFRTCFSDADCITGCSVSGTACLADSDCPGGEFCGTCADCKAPGQFCELGPRQCVTNPMVRRGTVDPTFPIKVAIFPIASTSSTAINSTAGVAGPGAITHPTSLNITGMP